MSLQVRVHKSDQSSIVDALDHQVSRKSDAIPTGNHLNWLLSARKGGGKSTLLLQALTNPTSPWYKYFDTITICSPTARLDPKFADLISDIEQSGQGHIYDTINNDIIEQVLSDLSEFNEKHKKRKGEKAPRHCVVIDDCIHLLPNSNTRKGESAKINRLFVTNRHYKCTNIICTQQFLRVNPLIRQNLDLLSLFSTENRREIESMANDFNLDEDKFKALFEFSTLEPNSFLHVNVFGGKPTFYKKFDRIEVTAE